MAATSSARGRAPLHPYIHSRDSPARPSPPSLARIAEQPVAPSEHAYRDSITTANAAFVRPAPPPCLSTAAPCSATAAVAARFYPERVRHLLRPALTSRLRTMQAFQHPPAPDSPPDLTDSKSSKSSSSFPDSSLSELTSPHDNCHFEDITLDDISTTTLHVDPREPTKAITTHPPMATSTIINTSATTTTLPHFSSSVSGGRDLISSSKPSLRLSVNNHAQSAASTLGIPNRRGMRKGFISPSTPSLISKRQVRSPSPAGSGARSPSKRFTAPPSPTSRGGPLDFRPGLMPTVRRQSWQPGRKTVAELEAEYHDSDEDLPEDAIMWNVPMSPRPPHRRPSRSPSVTSPDSSVSEPKRHVHASTSSKSPSRASPSSSRTPSTHSSIPEDSELDVARSKSWGDALDDMSQEARELTEALEEYAGETERQREACIQCGTAAPTRPSTEKAPAGPAVIQLPPVQKGNVMIDPLPISKEKEKVLSRTRPSWLPPKDPQEEKKHLKEYQKMMAAAQEAEKRMPTKLQEQREQRDTALISVARIWEQHILPNWDRVIDEPRTRELWWRGITPRNRGTVWKRAIGNDLGLSATSYRAALERAKTLDGKLAELDSDSRADSRESIWLDSIRRDTNAVFPDLRIFQLGGPLHDSLLDVLMAYAMYRSDVGYIYGTHLIAALLVLNMSPADSFVALANVLNRSLPMAFLVNDSNAMRRARDLVLETLHYKIPKLHHHLTKAILLDPDEFLDPLFRTMLCHGPGLDISSRIWDVYVFEGDKSLVRAVVGVLAALEGRLYGSRDEVLDLLGWAAEQEWHIKDEDAFMRHVRSAGKVDLVSTDVVGSKARR